MKKQNKKYCDSTQPIQCGDSIVLFQEPFPRLKWNCMSSRASRRGGKAWDADAQCGLARTIL